MATKLKDPRAAEILIAIAATNVNHTHNSTPMNQAVAQMRSMFPNNPQAQGIIERLAHEMVNGVLYQYINFAVYAMRVSGYRQSEVFKQPFGVASSQLLENVGKLLELERGTQEATEPAPVEV